MSGLLPETTPDYIRRLILERQTAEADRDRWRARAEEAEQHIRELGSWQIEVVDQVNGGMRARICRNGVPVFVGESSARMLTEQYSSKLPRGAGRRRSW